MKLSLQELAAAEKTAELEIPSMRKELALNNNLPEQRVVEKVAAELKLPVESHMLLWTDRTQIIVRTKGYVENTDSQSLGLPKHTVVRPRRPTQPSREILQEVPSPSTPSKDPFSLPCAP